MGYVLPGILGIAAILLYVWYASIVTRRNAVSEALSGVDVQLQQRHDLIPNMLAIARRFMEHEADLLQSITRLRAEATAQVGAQAPAAVAERFKVEAQLAGQMDRLMAVAENYPALRSDGPMIEAQRSYNEVEGNLAAARRFYNSAVGDLRNATQIFPGNLVKGLAGVGELPPFFETTEAARQPVSADALLGRGRVGEAP